jgi:SAM-dependent methyltransferase
MLEQSMRPHGQALLAYFQGDTAAELIVRRDDGLESRIPAGYFFRSPSDFSQLERTALQHCRGTILDIGAGAGPHALFLQDQGFRVIALDVDPDAVTIMRQRGVRDARCLDIYDSQDEEVSTMLLLGHGIGMAETMSGLDRFLTFLKTRAEPGGQVLLDTLDVRATNEPQHLTYQANNRLAGRYVGETRLQFTFRNVEGPWCGWLHVDAETLTMRAEHAGWKCEVLEQLKSGEYLARLYL